ncbi:HNH endonuclease [Budvicia diplopodorum]|uniref:HNH endonuclease n=1 Tax=Budvicia diplopodorum TaxID=1119056 RepID=UPI0013590721|nr:HNH endonuclease [Budvicia diplopodorum]
MALITQFGQAQDNAIRFSAVLQYQESRIFSQLSHIERWYYFPDAGVFAPGKFIEYQDADFNHDGLTYIDKALDTVNVLEQWFSPLDPNTSMYNDLERQLSQFLAKLGHVLSEEFISDRGGIHVPVSDFSITHYPDDVSAQYYREGSVRSVLVSGYERNPTVRTACIDYYGCVCYVCHFDFAKAYGEVGRGFIHVHHLKELSLIADDYEVNPVADLRPLCPNCHAMIHRTRPAMSPEALRSLIDENINGKT